MDLQFTLKNQIINRIDRNTIVSGSKNYLYAQFDFLTDDWHPPVTAIFGKYLVVLDNENRCLVPWEVLETPGYFTVSAFCGDLHTANTVSVYAAKSGYVEGETPSEPTPDVYTQLTGMVRDAIDRAEAATETAVAAAKSAEISATRAEEGAANAGWMYVHGKNDGYLYFVRSDNAPSDFTLKDNGKGELIAVYGD